MFAAIRASSRVSSFAVDRRPGSSLKYKLLAVVVAHDEVGVLFLNSPRWWKAAAINAARIFGILDDIITTPELVDPASIEVRLYQGRFAVFANGKLLRADFTTQTLAHMWLRRHLHGNGQIIGDPQTIIEWIGASDQSRSAH
jgi:hypothetical protein